MRSLMGMVLVCAFAAIALAGCAIPQSAAGRGHVYPPKSIAPAPIRVLIVDGYSNHDWRLTTRVIQSVLAQHGGFEVAVSTVPVNNETTTDTAQLAVAEARTAEALAAWEPHFENYDVVLQNFNNLKSQGGRPRPVWPPRVMRQLEDYVRGGGGLYVYHSAENSFAEWPEYNTMIGLGWRPASFGKAVVVDDDGVTTRTIPAGEGGPSNHERRHDALVTRLGNHPIHAGLPRSWLAADVEVYTYQRGPAENLSVLSWAVDPKTRLNQPMEWTVGYGAGRVYVSAYGHVWNNDGIQPAAECAAFQTLLVRGLQWTARADRGARRPVDTVAPPDFPTAQSISLRASPVPGAEGKPATRSSTTAGFAVWEKRNK